MTASVNGTVTHRESEATELFTACIERREVQQKAQLSPRDRAMRRVSLNLVNCHATVQKLLVRQVLNQVSAVAN